MGGESAGTEAFKLRFLQHSCKQIQTSPIVDFIELNTARLTHQVILKIG